MTNLTSVFLLLQFVLQLISNPETSQNPAVQVIVKNAIASATEVLSAQQFAEQNIVMQNTTKQQEQVNKPVPTIVSAVPAITAVPAVPAIPEGSIDTNDPKSNPPACKLKISIEALYHPDKSGVAFPHNLVINGYGVSGFVNPELRGYYSLSKYGAFDKSLKTSIRDSANIEVNTTIPTGSYAEGAFSPTGVGKDESVYYAQFGDTKCFAYLSADSLKNLGRAAQGEVPISRIESSENPL